MLKTLPIAKDYQRIKCGAVFYLDPKSYRVACVVCSEKIPYQLFPKHFRTKHLERGFDIQQLDIADERIEDNNRVTKLKVHNLDEESLQDVVISISQFNQDNAGNDIDNNNDSKSIESEDVADDNAEEIRFKEILAEEDDPISSKVSANLMTNKLFEKIKQLEAEIVQHVDSQDNEQPEDVNVKVNLRTKNNTLRNPKKQKIVPEESSDDSDEDKSDDESEVEVNLDLDEDSDSSNKTTSLLDEKSLDEEVHETGCSRRFLKGRSRRLREKRGKSKKKQESKEFKCNECDELLRNEREFNSHKYKHTGIVCDVCGMTFSQVGNLKRHKLRHTGVKQFKCSDCGKEFYTEKELNSHRIWHTQQFRFICEICAKPCVHQANLKQHMRRHTGERPYKCDHCGKCFFTQHDLNVHAAGHSDIRPFVCDTCGSSFRLKKALRVHKKIHIKERPFVCEICNKGFIVEAGLKAHMRCHDGTISKIALITAPQPNKSAANANENENKESSNVPAAEDEVMPDINSVNTAPSQNETNNWSPNNP